MPRIASGIASEGRRLRSILAAFLLGCVAVLALPEFAAAQSYPFPMEDDNQFALPGNTLPNPLRVSNDNEVPEVFLWQIVDDGTSGARLIGPGNIDGSTDGSRYAVQINPGGIGGPSLQLGPGDGYVQVRVCSAFKDTSARGAATEDFFICDSEPSIFYASTIRYEIFSSTYNLKGNDYVERGEQVFLEVYAYLGDSYKPNGVGFDFEWSGPINDFFQKGSGSGFIYFYVDDDAPDGAAITVTARPQANPTAAGVFSANVSTYQLDQVSPVDGVAAVAGTTVDLVVRPTWNNVPPDDEVASRTVSWEILPGAPPGTQFPDGLLTTTSDVKGSTAQIPLTIGQPNLGGNPIIVRATAFGNFDQARRGNGPPPQSANVRTVEFIINGTDLLEISVEAGDNQVADVGQPLSEPLVVEVYRNEEADVGRQINWTVSPPNAVTFANGASSQTSIVGETGSSQVSVSSVNIGGSITVTATHDDDPGVSASFSVTGIGPTLELVNPTGDGQFGATNAPFPEPLGITATGNGQVQSGVLVNWSVNPPGAAILGSAQTATGSDGETTNTVTAGAIGTSFTVTASRNDDPSVSYVFGLTSVDRRLTKPTNGSGDGQNGDPGQLLPEPLVVLATNNGFPAGEVTILWDVNGDATLDNNKTLTDKSGRSEVNVTLGPSTGTVTVVARRADAPGSTTSFVLTSGGSNDVLTITQPADSGDGESGPPGAAIQLTAQTLRNGEPDAGIEVDWSILSGQGRLATFSNTSNGSGIVRNTVTLPAEGVTRVRAARADRPQTSVVFVVTTTADGELLAIVEGNTQSGSPGTRGTPLGVRLTRNGAPVADAPITWEVVSGSLTLDAPQTTTGTDGIARVGFAFGSEPGAASVRASNGTQQVNFSLTVTQEPGGGGVSLRLVGGAGQTGAIGTRADLPLIVEVLDANGDPVAGRRVDWEVTAGSAVLDVPVLTTDANGRASQGFTFGPSAGPIVIQATISATLGGSVEIPATSFVPGLSAAGGSGQSAPVSTTLPQDLVVSIAPSPSGAKALAGVPIRWTVTQGGGSLAFAETVTDANGLSTNQLTLGPTPGVNQVTASVEGGGNVVFTATATGTGSALTIVSGNNQNLPTASDSAPLVVELRSPDGLPVEGASIDWAATNASFVGEVTTTVTDAQGRSSNRVRIDRPGAAAVVAQLRGSDNSRVTFALDGRVANTPQLDQPQETVARAVDNLCPALEDATTLSPEQQDLLARCRELVDNAGANPDQVQDALDQYEQDVSLALADAALGGLNAQFDNVRQRISQLRGGRAGGKGIDLTGLGFATSSGMMPLSFLPSIVQASDEGEGGGGEAGADFGRWGFFASGIIGRAEQDGDSNSPKYDYDTSGLTAGVDYRVNDSWVVGAALGYTRQDTELGDGGGDVDASGWSVTGYSTWYHSRNWYLDGVLSYGSNDYDLSRSIVYQIVGANGTVTQVNQVARASTDGDQWMASIAGGRDFQKGPWSFGPYLRASYQRVEFDAYDEQLQAGPGSGLGLAVQSRALKSMTGVLGGKVSYAMSRDWGILLPYAQLEWEHEFKDDPQQVVTRFLYDPTGTVIRLNGQEIDTDYFNIGVGLSAVFPGGRSGFIYYERVAGSEGLSQDSLSLGVRIEF